jgi:hypothetical protein
MEADMKNFTIFCAFLLFFVCSSASAVTLEWKFAAGDEENYRLTQSAKLSSGEGNALKQFAAIEQELDIKWKVLEVDKQGTATITVQIAAMSMLASGPDGQEVRFDSESTDEPQGYAAILRPLGKRLSESEVQLKMSPRGEVTDVKLPEELSDAVKSVPGGKKFAIDGGMSSFESLARLGAPRLWPSEEVTAETSWNEKREIELPVLGKVDSEFVYTVEEPISEDRVAIDQVLKLDASKVAADLRMKIINQESAGTIDFNVAEGRSDLSNLTYVAEFEQKSQEASRMKLEHTIEFRRVVDDSQ